MKRYALVGCLIAFAGCQSFIDNKAADATIKLMQRSKDAGKRTPDVELAREALPGGILQLQAFALAYPDRREFKVMHADALCSYATGFVFDDWDAAKLEGRDQDAKKIGVRVKSLARECVEANLDLMPKEWRADHETGGDAWTARIASTKPDQVPQLLSITGADALQIALSPLSAITKIGPITAALEKSIALKPGFHDNQAELMLATVQANKSQFLGGPDGGLLFAKIRAAQGDGALLTEVMYARGTLVAKKDRAGFETTLNKVLDADVTKWPDRRLTNEIARMKAQRYLDAEDKIIPPPAPAEPPPAAQE
ncbi:MAG TPA: TRAP transporter TatT component family protein [Kofleriaceae bacterium]|jgi:hypothetical protein